MNFSENETLQVHLQTSPIVRSIPHINTKYWKGKNIMIIEDVLSNFQLLAAYLIPLEANIIHESFGYPALETIKSRKDINLVLIDIRLPDVNGLEIIRKIREFDTEVPIIAQTAFAMFTDRKHCIDAGCNDYIAKPIKRNDFLDILSRCAI